MEPSAAVSAGEPMPHRRAWLGIGFVVLALASEWTSHALTWILGGGVTAGQAFAGSMHRYLEPTGAVLLAVGAAVSAALWLLTRALDRMVQRFREARDRSRAGADDLGLARRVARSGPRVETSAAGIWAALLCVQLVVYLVQENVEVHLAGHPLPWGSVLVLRHGLPVLVHSVVALGAAALAVTVADRVLGATRAAMAEARRYLAAVFPVPVSDPGPAAQATDDPPAVRIGHHVLVRPPPLASV